MIHIGENTKSTIISKGISAGYGQQTYRGEVKIMKNAHNARNYSECDSILIGDHCGAHTFPYIDIKMHQLKWNMKQQPQKLGKNNYFIVIKEGSLLKMLSH